MVMADMTQDPASKADIQHLEDRLEAKIDGIKSWITGVAFVTGVAIIISLASINIAIITALGK